MQFFEEMKSAIENCGNPDSATRKNGESEIKRMRDEDPRKFLISLVNELGQASNSAAARQLAAIVLKNFITNKQRVAKYQDFWIKIDVKERAEIKAQIIASLQCPEQLVRNQVAGVIAAVACIEVPRQEWDELIPQLCEHVQNASVDVGLKHASLLTLGYICEDLQPEDISTEVKNKIVQTLVVNVSDEVDAAKLEMTKLAIRAFYFSIPYASHCFKEQTDRDFIMDKLIKVFALQDETVLEHALQCLSEIATQEYEHLDPYFIHISKATEQCSLSESNKVGAQAFEFWVQLTEHEHKLKTTQAPCKDLIVQSKTQLLALIFQGLAKVDFDDDEYEWGTALAAACCLQAVAQVLKDEVIQPVIEFVAESFKSDELVRKQSGLIALGSIFEGPNRGKLAGILVQAMPQLFALGQHEAPKIRETVAWVFGRLSEHHAEVVTASATIESFMQLVVKGLQDVPRVSSMYCRALTHLAESLQPSSETEQSNALTPFYQLVLEELFKTANRTDHQDSGVDLVQNAYVALISMVQYSCLASKDANYQLLTPFLTKLEGTVGVEDPGDNVQHLQDNLCGLIQALLVKVGEMVQKPLADNIVMLIIQLFKQANTVTENGLIIMNGLANGCCDVLEIHQLCQYLKHALEIKEKVCTRMACGIISDLAYGKPEEIKQFLDDYVPCLHDLLRDNTIDRDIKIHALRALADLALNCGESFKREFLQWSVEAINMAAKGSVELAGANSNIDPATASFMNELREEVLKSYSNFIIAFEDANQLDLMAAHLGTIYEFIQRLVQIIGYNEVNLTKSIVALVGDIVERFGNNSVVKTQSIANHIEQSIFMLQRQTDPECRDQAQATLNLIQQMIKA